MQITTAVSETKDAVLQTGGELSPQKFYGRTDLVPRLVNSEERPITMIDFDVAVTVTEEAGTIARIGVVAGIFGAGVGSAEKSQATGVSRIQFQIPLVLP